MTHKRRLDNSTGGSDYSRFRVLHRNYKNNNKKKRHKSCRNRDISDKVGKGYPTMRLLERERRERDNGDHFKTLINFISFYPILVPCGHLTQERETTGTISKP